MHLTVTLLLGGSDIFRINDATGFSIGCVLVPKRQLSLCFDSTWRIISIRNGRQSLGKCISI